MKICFEQGNGIHGEVIVCECRKLGKFDLVQGSGKHRASHGKLTGNALCVIERKLRVIPERRLKLTNDAPGH